MPVISIIGAPGVGKSFLTTQLAALNCAPAFFEGEAGIFPAPILKKLNSENDSRDRFVWILDRCARTLQQAHKASRAGCTVVVDGGIHNVQAWLQAETGEHSPAVLKEWLKTHEHLTADVTIALTATSDYLEQSRKRRGRSTELSDFIVRRAKRINEAVKNLAKEKGFVVVDRTKLDFTDQKTLEKINKLFPSHP